MSEFSQYSPWGQVKTLEYRNPPFKSSTDIQQVFIFDLAIFCEDIRAHWPYPEDFLDLGGGIKALPYVNILARGEAVFKKVLKAIDKKRARKAGSTIKAFDRLWARMKLVQQEETPYV